MPTRAAHPLVVSPLMSGLLLAAALALAGCGGAGDTVAALQTRAAPQALDPLFDAQGRARPSPRGHVPADTAARTRTGLYATAAQLEWELLTATPVTLLIDVDQLGSVQAAVMLAQQVAWMRDTRGLAFFVRARHAPDAAHVVDTLADAGFAPIFMVV